MQKENIFTHKILPILSILIFISFVFINNNVFAATYDLRDYKNHLHSGSAWVLVYSIDNDNFYIVTGGSNFHSYSYCGTTTLDSGEIVSTGYFLFSNFLGSDMSSGLGDVYVCSFNKESNTFGTRVKYGWDDNPTSKIIGKCRIIASGQDVHPFNKSDVFFQQTPVPSKVIIAQTILAEELEKIQVTDQWKTLMKNVVVSLVVFLVGFLSFRKAWAFLKTQMKVS